MISSNSRIYRVLQESGFYPGTIYDVGASTGCWSASMALLYPQAVFHLFEPLAEFHEPYREGLAGELQKNPNFYLHVMALGETTGVVPMAVSVNPQGSTLLDIPVSSYFPGQVKVPRHSIDELVGNRILPAPELMKLDVQGSENKILLGAVQTLEKVLALQVECWLYPGYGPETALMPEIISFLDGHGFVAVEFSDPYYSETHQLHTLDLYFLKKELARSLSSRWPKGHWCQKNS